MRKGTATVAAAMILQLCALGGAQQDGESERMRGIVLTDDVTCAIVALGDAFTVPYGISLIGNSLSTLLKHYYEEDRAYLTSDEYAHLQEAGVAEAVIFLFAFLQRMTPMTASTREAFGGELFPDDWLVEPQPGLFLDEDNRAVAAAELTLCVRNSEHSVVADPVERYDLPIAIGAPIPADGVPMSGTPLRQGDWTITGGSRVGGIEFRDVLGEVGFSESADAGYDFALVPVAVHNASRRTASLFFAQWLLVDDVGYEYTPQTLADMYLGDDRLVVTDVPPGATREGFLVFQVRSGARWLTLRYVSGQGELQWRFVLRE